MKEKVLAVNVKKIIRWATGYAIFVTKEAKELGWNDKTRVLVSAIEDDKGKGITVREVKIHKK
ncbi:MAG: hypothetical protein KKB25_02125 [Nanoarchaeota archaeon]|nr:hypothetical protein [Nanoarchaeota archaeon]